jgi:hypothetical protein
MVAAKLGRIDGIAITTKTSKNYGDEEPQSEQADRSAGRANVKKRNLGRADMARPSFFRDLLRRWVCSKPQTPSARNRPHCGINAR